MTDPRIVEEARRLAAPSRFPKATSTRRFIVLYIALIAVGTLISRLGGPWWSVVSSGLMIGPLFTIRHRLHDVWGWRWFQRTGLIASGGVASLVCNVTDPRIALASTVAFVASLGVGAAIYERLREAPWKERVFRANLVSAGIDSLLFPTIAFGSVLWKVAAAQFFAKLVGGQVATRFIHGTRR